MLYDITQVAINASLHARIYLDALKLAKIAPTFKRSDRTKPDNSILREILPGFTIIIEKLILKRLKNYCKKNTVISDSKYGFLKRKSTEYGRKRN